MKSERRGTTRNTSHGGRWASAIGAIALAGGLGIAPAAAAPDGDRYAPKIDPADFVTTIDNPYLPLVPGTRWVYEGVTEKGTEQIVVEVTDQTKEVLGVVTTVVHDVVRLDGALIEDTVDWYAQDQQGNVWYFGEDTKEYEHGRAVSDHGSWEAGFKGAQPGIVMEASPQVGDRYRQEYFEGEAEDMAKVIAVDATATVPAGSYTDVVKTKDFTPLEPKLREHKYYARGVGVVLEVTFRGGSERVELVEHRAP
jgi:hypothetical protein